MAVYSPPESTGPIFNTNNYDGYYNETHPIIGTSSSSNIGPTGPTGPTGPAGTDGKFALTSVTVSTSRELDSAIFMNKFIYFNGDNTPNPALTLTQLSEDDAEIHIYNASVHTLEIMQASLIPISSYENKKRIPGPGGVACIKQKLLTANVRTHLLMGNLV
jgi:hypothetical protein